jgi:dihydroorotate dehydrogenase electron transfer subunit
MHHLQAKIVTTHPEGADYQVLILECPSIATTVQAGQFVHVRVSEAADPLLRRPISVMLADRQAGHVRLLVRKVGRGTELLAALPTGAEVDLLGPLGNGFPLPEVRPGQDVLLVAGGVGVAPLVFLADALQMHPARFRVCGLFGGASDEHLPLWTELAGRCEEFHVSTEDGSAGDEGLVTALLAEQLGQDDTAVVYACGPRAMMAVVARMCAEAEVPCWVSLEQWMGCGVGACLGCVVPATGETQYLRVCKDGPVFAATAIAWDSP